MLLDIQRELLSSQLDTCIWSLGERSVQQRESRVVMCQPQPWGWVEVAGTRVLRRGEVRG